MESELKKSFIQFDRQTNDRVIAHINLSNLYLKIERGEIELTRHSANQLWLYLRMIYPPETRNDFHNFMTLKLINHWEQEFLKLPNAEIYF